MNEIDNLQEQLDLHRQNLKKLDDSIKKLNGNQNFDDENQRLRNDRKRKINERKNLLNEEEDDDELSVKKPSLQSSVVTKSINIIKSKEDLIKIQNKDTGSQQRNKRILGVILGTLKQFKTEDKERSNTEQAQQRKELEKKIEIKKLEEKQKMIDEKKKLESEKSKNLRNIEILETKIHLTDTFDLWKNNHLKLKNFIRTKAKPSLFYLPKILDEKSETLLNASCKLIQNEYDNKKAYVDKELKALNEETDALNSNEEKKDEIIKKEIITREISNEEVDELEDEDKTNNVRLGDEDDDEQNNSSNIEQNFIKIPTNESNEEQ